MAQKQIRFSLFVPLCLNGSKKHTIKNKNAEGFVCLRRLIFLAFLAHPRQTNMDQQ